MDAGRSPAVFRCRCDSASETAEFSVSLALRPPMHHRGPPAGNVATSGIPAAIGAGRDEVNNPLYWRLKPAARELSRPHHKGSKQQLEGIR